MENMISMMATEKPFERLQSLEQKINEVDKIQTIENYIAQLKERIWAVKEVLTTAEASAYLGLSESYIYKLTSLKQIPHYKPNGKLVQKDWKQEPDKRLRQTPIHSRSSAKSSCLSLHRSECVPTP